MAGFPVFTLFQAGGINSISFAGVEFAASWSRVFRPPRLRYSVKDSFLSLLSFPHFFIEAVFCFCYCVRILLAQVGMR
jgi:hypothetical protein